MLARNDEYEKERLGTEQVIINMADGTSDDCTLFND